MSGNFKKDDLRVIKTRHALENALTVLLAKHSFSKMTVNNICGEALVSRAAFYTHFTDKYDLLRYWLSCERDKWTSRLSADPMTAGAQLDTYLRENTRLLHNLTSDMNEELLRLIFEVFSEKIQPFASARSVFFGGGVVALLAFYGRHKTSLVPGDLAPLLLSLCGIS